MRPVRIERASDTSVERSRMRGTKNHSIRHSRQNHTITGSASQASAEPSSRIALVP